MEFIFKSHIGIIRRENQDKVGVVFKENKFFAFVCDGLGGHIGGEKAANITANIFEKEFKDKVKKLNIKNYDKWFTETLKKIKKEMNKLALENNTLWDMGTTICAAIIDKKNIFIFNIGDSRAYIFDDNLKQITKDHNLINFYNNNLNLNKEILASKTKYILTSALGPRKKMQLDKYKIIINSKIKFLIMTSDGIHDSLSKTEFEKIISLDELTIEKKAEKLIQKSILNNSSDNLSVLIMKVN